MVVKSYYCFCSIFRNGDALFRGVRVLLPKKIMHSWENVSFINLNYYKIAITYNVHVVVA